LDWDLDWYWERDLVWDLVWDLDWYWERDLDWDLDWYWERDLDWDLDWICILNNIIMKKMNTLILYILIYQLLRMYHSLLLKNIFII
jgi:hypothetical protein